MRELVTVDQVERLFRLLAVAAPIVGGVLGAAYGLRRAAPARWSATGAAIGLLGTLNYGLWRMYCAITNHYGLDSVRNLLINLSLFVLLGLVGGIGYGLWERRRVSRRIMIGRSEKGAVPSTGDTDGG